MRHGIRSLARLLTWLQQLKRVVFSLRRVYELHHKFAWQRAVTRQLLVVGQVLAMVAHELFGYIELVVNEHRQRATLTHPHARE